MNNNLELMLTDDFETELESLNDFRIVSGGSLADSLREKFHDRLNETSDNVVITDDEPSESLQQFFNKTRGMVVAAKGTKYFGNKPLFLISIPKAGTHLLLQLAEEMGYKHGGACGSVAKGGHWYSLGPSLHTSAVKFLMDVRSSTNFGNRDHPFTTAPAIFIYRNPLDIACSEANYYHKEGKMVFSGYLEGLSYDERLSRLINDKWLFGSIRDRISEYIAWTKFGNVVSVSYEEMVGDKGGGNENAQIRLIWSLMLKLQVPGKPGDICGKIYNNNSATYFRGKIGTYRDYFKEEHYNLFRSLDQDFMNELGYSFEKDMPDKTDHFLNKHLVYQDNIDFPPILKKNDFYGYNIVKYKNIFYGIPVNTQFNDYDFDTVAEDIFTEESIEALQTRIILPKSRADLLYPPRLDVSGYKEHNIVKYAGLYYGVPYKAGKVDIQKGDLPECVMISKSKEAIMRAIDEIIFNINK